MPQIINTNIASLNAQRNLNASQNDANTALQRLSSGLRINSAKDDAAGLAISERFESQITGLNMAQRNANDGISLAQTTEGALDEITANLQRVRELAVQSANASNSKSDRDALNAEVQQRIAEINRIAAQTSFNGLRVLDGSLPTQTFQVGANAGETISVNGLDARATELGSLISHASGIANVSGADYSLNQLFEERGTADFTIDLPTLSGGTVSVAISGVSTLEGILGKINAESSRTGITANLDRSNNGLLFSTELDGAITGSALSGIAITVSNASINGTAVTLNQTAFTGGTAEEATVNKIDISTQDGADLAMVSLDFAIDQINSLRADLGAVQNRFESTIANLATTTENLSASNSRIRDADFAKESAELARTQVLQQAGLSVLAQANARPQQVLQLLQG
ncbi:flagellin [Marinobacter daepoensis]|uniref:Flagellin n=1 Tax=Marinobacter daepoensis TaxID=262077 RepID=A0ABS3BM96_9GAMM|nr:flagellin [Marinobacter daepoensis]MBN7771305.1 flagellin [Marinobacter daepoensis]MBY6079167.1 flagellin [Marinobacter daepoensis]